MNKLLTYIFIIIHLFGYSTTNNIDTYIKSKKLYYNYSNINISTKKNHQTYLLKNLENIDLSIVVELPIDKIEKLIITYKNNNNQIVDTFLKHTNISERKYYDRDIIFEYNLKPQSTAQIDIEMQVKNVNDNIDVYVWNKIAKINSTQTLELSKGVFYGIMFLFLFICWVLYWLIKEKNYLWFFIYLLFGTIYLLIKQNIAYEFLWSKYPEVDLFIKKIILVSYLVVSLNFLRLFILRRIPNFALNKSIKTIVFIGISIILFTLTIGLFKERVRNIFSIFEYIYIVFCVLLFILSFVISFIKFEDKTMFYFLLSFMLSFSFFLFYPVPSTSKYISEINIRQIFIYSNAFVIALVISSTILYRVLQLINSNKEMRQQVSILHAQKNFAAITAQMNEKKRVGKELHDGIGILMATTKMKISSIKANNAEDEEKLRDILRKIDDTTQKIRKISHDLLPPTLQKFGINTAIHDVIEQYNLNKSNKIKYNLDIDNNLNEVSNYIIYDVVVNLIKYLYNSENYNIEINIKNAIQNNHHIIEIRYSGNSINLKNIYIKNINTIVELLHGSVSQELINTFTHKMIIELPVQR